MPFDATNRPTARALAALRLAMSWVFIWPFLDKTFGLGFATPSERAWIRGGHPTRGYLGNQDGTFGDLFTAIADRVLVEWLFMLGLLGIGVALLFGAGMRPAAATGSLMLVLMWVAAIPLDHNPFLDDHLVYAGLLVALAIADAGRTWGVGAWWQATALVHKARWLA